MKIDSVLNILPNTAQTFPRLISLWFISFQIISINFRFIDKVFTTQDFYHLIIRKFDSPFQIEVWQVSRTLLDISKLALTKKR